MAGIVYSIRKNRFKQAYLKGFSIEGEDALSLEAGTSIHILLLRSLDCAEKDAEWSRLCFEADIPESMVYYVYALAANENSFLRGGRQLLLDDYFRDPDISVEEKRIFLERRGALRTVGKSDILLHEISGRYLYLFVEIVGTGEGRLKRIKVERESDVFYESFPEIYRADKGFFRRFISIFSSIYNDFDKDIDQLPKLLDLDECPAECLPVFAAWLGIDISGNFLSEEKLRTLVKEAYKLNRLKGTKACLERLVEIVLGEKPMILEQNMIKAYEEKGGFPGESLRKSSIYDVNILIRHKLMESERFQLLYLIDQFKPLRARIHLIQLREGSILDSNVYLDLNAEVERTTDASLDKAQDLSENIILQ